MEWFHYFLVLLVGFIAGYINTLSGSGSLLTLPLLIFLGLPANVANGTNRISILFQTLVSTYSYRNQNILNIKRGLLLVLPVIPGAILGAVIAVDLDEKMMNYAIGILLIVMALLIILKPERWFSAKNSEGGQIGWKSLLLLFAVGFYGGFIQAGVGLFLLALLVSGLGMDVLHANAYKNFFVLCFTVFAILVFVINDQIAYLPGFVMAFGSMGGAWLASKMSVKKGPALISWFVLAMILISALQLLGVFHWITRA